MGGAISALKAKAYAVVITGVLAASPSAHGAGWPAPQGETQTIFTYIFDTADRQLGDRDGQSIDIDFQKQELSAYVEYGLTNRISLVGKPVIQHISSEKPDGAGGVEREDVFGLGGSELGARFLLARAGGAAFSVQLTALTPGVAENASGSSLGDGGFGGEVRLLAGNSWGWRQRGGFVEGQIAYRDRSDTESPEGRVDLTLGLRPSTDWMVLAQSFSHWSTEPVRGFPDPDPQYLHSHRVQLSAVRHLGPDWAVQAGGFTTVAGRNVIDERAGFLSLWRKY